MKLLSFVLLLLSSTSFAASEELNTIVSELNAAPQIDLSEEVANSSSMDDQQTPWQYSATYCAARTFCGYDNWGRQVWINCAVYGYQYSGFGGSGSSSCQWYVVPGYSVQCQGYTQTRDYYGNVIWGWQNFRFTCY